ncbi:arginase [Lishizhenia sp.]|uniref:arginase n=1 Tax=Lishizhenia sp. TaxID=2497594 RepID=UPI00299D2C06|nr:arginase [Lishizhenia sp.]MDX1444874.1 arginase [Lishizhenia sp.]
MARNISIVINESEITAGTRGASLGPGAIQVAARNRNNDMFGRYPLHTIETENHLLDTDVKYRSGKRIDGLVKIYDRVSEVVKSIRQKNDFALVIAGDHGSAGGTIAGLKMANPNKRIGVLWVDAHGDMHTPYTTPTGNMHGMPLATALNEDNLECRINEVSEDTAAMWEKLKNTGGIAPKITPEDLAFIALRDTEEPEDKYMERVGIKNYTVAELREKSTQKVLEELDAKFAACDEVYVSFDVDSMNPADTSHGTGTPVDNGLHPDEAEQILLHFAAQEKVSCIEFVEVNPCLDEKTNKMAEVAFDFIEKVVNVVAK